MLTCLSLRRLLLVPVALALAVGAAFALSPDWARAAGLDVWNMPRLEQAASEATERAQQLDYEDVEIRQRIRAKEVLVTDLIEGRSTLAEVTTQFEELNRPYPEYLKMIRYSFPGATDEEKLARNVIDYTLPRVSDPSRRHALALRLDAELRSMVAGGEAAH